MRSRQGSPGIHHCRATRVREETARRSSAQRLRKVDGSVKIVTLVSGPLLLDRFHAGKCDPTSFDRHQSKSALVLAEQAHWPFSLGSNCLDPGWKILLECYLLSLTFLGGWAEGPSAWPPGRTGRSDGPSCREGPSRVCRPATAGFLCSCQTPSARRAAF